MSLVCYEMLDSMSGSVSNDLEQGETREVRRSYVIGQCDGFNHAVREIEQYAPQYVEADGAGIYWRRSRLEVNGIGNRYFQVVATYGTLIPKNDGGGGESPPGSDPVPGSIAWDTTGHTEHITQSKFTNRFPAEAPNFRSAINVSGNTVNGVDVVRPCLRYSETWILPASLAVSAAFVGAVYDLTGSVNFLDFRAFKPGEALFMGARATWQGDLPYVAVTFDFEARPNEEFTPPGFAQPINKFGWEYVWYLYETDADNNRLVQRISSAYVEKVYEMRSWTALRITGAAIGAAQRGVAGAAPNAAGNGLN